MSDTNESGTPACPKCGADDTDRWPSDGTCVSIMGCRGRAIASLSSENTRLREERDEWQRIAEAACEKGVRLREALERISYRPFDPVASRIAREALAEKRPEEGVT